MKVTDLAKGAVVVTPDFTVMTLVTDVNVHRDGVTFAVQYMGRNGAHALTVQKEEIAGWRTYEAVDRWWV